MEFLVQLRPVTSVKRTLTQTLLCESRQQSELISWDVNEGMCIIFDISASSENETLTRFPGCRGKAELRELLRPKGVLKFLLPKTSKIIFIPFSITLSPCVFWSQHDSSLLLSLYSRWWGHTGGKSVLALARSNATMRKRLHFSGMKFFTAAIFSRRHAALFSPPSHFSFFFQTRIAEICVRLVSRLPFLR